MVVLSYGHSVIVPGENSGKLVMEVVPMGVEEWLPDLWGTDSNGDDFKKGGWQRYFIDA